jgi:hypothetical protein
MEIMSTLETQLRKAAKASGRSMLNLSQASGLHYQSVHSFMAKGKALTVESSEKLAKALGFKLMLVRDPKGR